MFSLSAFSQTSKELIVKWKLVKQTHNREITNPNDTYQIFMKDVTFQRVNEDKTRKRS